MQLVTQQAFLSLKSQVRLVLGLNSRLKQVLDGSVNLHHYHTGGGVISWVNVVSIIRETPPKVRGYFEDPE